MNSIKMNEFDHYEIYQGNDLGAVYTKSGTRFRLWAPTACGVELFLYDHGNGEELPKIFPMTKDEGGSWVCGLKGDYKGRYYTFHVFFDEYETETVDPYAKAVGVNGLRGMIVDLSSTNPNKFDLDQGPQLVSYTDAVIYEISVADTTGDLDAGVKNAGKYLGLTEEGTHCPSGFSTGLDHIKELGVTHVQLMPSYDFGSVDETITDGSQYNWGYDPVNYFVPEGSYSTDPYHGEVRIKEFKTMVQKFHDAGIGVIMDVVFNHTYTIMDSCFQKTVPDYFYRMDQDKYSDASACGNEVASERTMVRKYIIDCLCYWAKEYHIDGFRFDLMGVIDIETMNAAVKQLIKINPFIMIYGEGWTGGESVLPADMRALKVNCDAMESVAMFSDDIRDAIRGDVFIASEKGFATGQKNMVNDLRFNIVAACKHPGVDYDKYQYTKSGAWASSPADTINYISCHDNLTLWDKIYVTNLEEDVSIRKKRNKLAASIVMTSQGVPFMLSGEEFLRDKRLPNTDEVCENSYNLSLEVNSMKYQKLVENRDVFEYYKGLIALRKAHSLFRLTTTSAVERFLTFLDLVTPNVVAYVLVGAKERILVVFNANETAIDIKLPNNEEWNLHVNESFASDQPIGILSGSTTVEGLSALVAIQDKN